MLQEKVRFPVKFGEWQENIVSGKIIWKVAGKSMSSWKIWRVAGNMENAKIIWQVAGKVKFKVAGKSKISG